MILSGTFTVDLKYMKRTLEADNPYQKNKRNETKVC